MVTIQFSEPKDSLNEDYPSDLNDWFHIHIQSRTQVDAKSEPIKCTLAPSRNCIVKSVTKLVCLTNFTFAS